jgi:hypothetical protein
LCASLPAQLLEQNGRRFRLLLLAAFEKLLGALVLADFFDAIVIGGFRGDPLCIKRKYGVFGCHAHIKNGIQFLRHRVFEGLQVIAFHFLALSAQVHIFDTGFDVHDFGRQNLIG